MDVVRVLSLQQDFPPRLCVDAKNNELLVVGTKQPNRQASNHNRFVVMMRVFGRGGRWTRRLLCIPASTVEQRHDAPDVFIRGSLPVEKLLTQKHPSTLPVSSEAGKHSRVLIDWFVRLVSYYA